MSTATGPWTVTDEVIDDILVTAFEGGINYWTGANPIHVERWPEGAVYASDCVSRGTAVWVAEVGDEGFDFVWHRLTRQNVVRGIRRAAEHYKQTVEGFHESHDAWGADVAVQFAVFGEIVYG